jgi:DNA-binding response OmpR family regulator
MRPPRGDYMQKVLDGLRIMVVEDEYLLAMDLEEAILELGGDVVGPFGRLQPAVAAARSEKLNGALLDVRLDGESIYDLADELIALGVPVILATGSDPKLVPAHLRSLPWLKKPYDYAALQDLIGRIYQPVPL